MSPPEIYPRVVETERGCKLVAVILSVPGAVVTVDADDLPRLVQNLTWLCRQFNIDIAVPAE